MSDRDGYRIADLLTCGISGTLGEPKVWSGGHGHGPHFEFLFEESDIVDAMEAILAEAPLGISYRYRPLYAPVRKLQWAVPSRLVKSENRTENLPHALEILAEEWDAMEAIETLRSTTSVSIKLSKERTKEGAMLWRVNDYGKNVAFAPIGIALALARGEPNALAGEPPKERSESRVLRLAARKGREQITKLIVERKRSDAERKAMTR